MFSEVVDTCIARSRRGDLATSIAAWENLTIQEMIGKHFFAKNMIEEQVIQDGGNPFRWPTPARFQRMRSVKDGLGEFPTFAAPGKLQSEVTKFYYRTPDYFIFKALEGDVFVSYYQFPKKLKYYTVADRPAIYDFVTETWTYLPAYAVDDATKQNARDLVSNWVLRDWYELVQEGVLAKTFKAANDETRAATHFSFFERTYSSVFLTAEAYETFDK